VLLLAAACGGPRTVVVRVSEPGADSAPAPAAGIGVVALPYDRDSVISALERRAGSPRPSTAALDSLFARFRGPFVAYTRASLAATALGDTVAALQRRAESLPRDAAEAGALAARIAERRRALSTLAAVRDSAQRALDRARTEFDARGDSLRARIRRWEDSTYQGWDSIVSALVQRSGSMPTTDTTDGTGWARLTLHGPGPWWIYAQAWDTGDPNAEWYWNVRAAGDTVLLTPANGRHKPKY
jgi:hypothetical protein